MRKLAPVLVFCAMLSSCASVTPDSTRHTQISPDYLASGDADGVRAFVYGKRTVLELSRWPFWLSIRDGNGVPVAYEREGQYIRFARQLDAFTVWLNTRALSFIATPHASAGLTTVAMAPRAAVPVAPAAAAPKLTMIKPAPEAPVEDAQADALLQLSAAQLEELRRAIETGAATPAERQALLDRLERIEAQLTQAATAIVRVHFDNARTDFRPGDDIEKVLVPAARAAERINVRGRTDSRVAGAADPRIALGRALAARSFLVDRGVSSAKIRVFSLSAGDHAAPATSAEGKAFNRRVEIELVNKRYGALAQRTTPTVLSTR